MANDFNASIRIRGDAKELITAVGQAQRGLQALKQTATSGGSISGQGSFLGALSKGFRQAATEAQSSANKIRQQTRSIADELRNLKSSAGALIGVGVGGASIASVIKTADAYKSVQARLQLATGSASEFAQAQSNVNRIATSTLAPLNSITTLYGRLSTALQGTGASQQKISDVTEAVALSLRVSGASAEESASATLQLSQAFASGALRGEEFNAVNEAAPRLMRALADGLGVNVGQLRKMAENGELTADRIGGALVGALTELRTEAAKVPASTSGAFEVLKNNVTRAIGELDKSLGVTNKVAGAMLSAAGNVKQLGTAITGVLVTALATMATRATASVGVAGIAGLLARIPLLFTGPAGIIAAVGLAATAFLTFGQKGENALQKLIDKQKQLAAEQGKKPGEATALSPQRQEIVDLGKARDDLKKEIAGLQAKANEPLGGLAPSNFITSDQIDAQKKSLQEQIALRQQDLKIGDSIITRKALELVDMESEQQAREGVTGTIAKQNGAVADLINGLTEETSTFGKSERQVIQYQAALAGATSAQRALIDGLLDLKEAQAGVQSSKDKATELGGTFKSAREQINAGGAKDVRLADPLKEKSVLDVGRALDEARAAASSGNGDDAIRKAETARNIIQELSAAGTASKSFLNDLLGQAEKVATGVTGKAQEKQQDKIGEIQERLKELQASANIPVQLDQSKLEAELTSVHDILNNMVKDKPVVIPTVLGKPGDSGQANDGGVERKDLGDLLKRASGGPIFGPGTGTSDSILVRMSNNEHVLTAREVAAAGGHGAIYRLRQMLMQKTLRFADGGGLQIPNIPTFPSSSGPSAGSGAGSGSNIYLQIGGEQVGPLRSLDAQIDRKVRDIVRKATAQIGVPRF